MKKTIKHILLLVALAVTAVTNLSAQVSKNIVDTTKQWNVAALCWNGIVTYSYKVSSNDTIINGKKYNELLCSVFYDSDMDIWYNWEHRDWIREDGGKVYVFTTDQIDTNGSLGPVITKSSIGEEYLLYDFNLQQGDTIDYIREIYFWGGYSFPVLAPNYVTEVDSVNIDGELLKRIIIENNYGDKEIWIQGIGSNRGLLESFNADYSLVCCKQDNNVLFNASRLTWGDYNSDNTCYIDVSLNEENITKCRVYPTITKDLLNITSIDYPMSVYIINGNGHIVLQKRLYDADVLNIEHLPQGKYVVMGVLNNNNIFNQKIIKL
ncbi:MAG: T9SS type A sorting domain-containing protein [Bacteroidales bacterium]|nr:T9SS type A sorting domain-containing protein [Bacteroidales bacterium]